MARSNVRNRAAAPVKDLKPAQRLKSEAAGLVDALGDRAVGSVRDAVEGATDRLTDYVENGAGPGLMSAVTGARDLAEGKGPVRSLLGAGIKGTREKIAGAFGGKGKGGRGRRGPKVTNIIESIDVGVPVELAYDQWTRFTDFPKFMKKVENVDQAEDEKLNWKAQVLWSHRAWEATILEQKPEDKIVWRSKGEKGHVDGAVTFHELAPNLTRIIVVLEYHPQGLFERTGNLWRAQGRRVRLEMKHFQRQMMSDAILHPDDVQGWRGTIEDSEVVDAGAQGQEEEEPEEAEEPRGEAGEESEESEADEEYEEGEPDSDRGARGERRARQVSRRKPERSAERRPSRQAAGQRRVRRVSARGGEQE